MLKRDFTDPDREVTPEEVDELVEKVDETDSLTELVDKRDLRRECENNDVDEDDVLDYLRAMDYSVYGWIEDWGCQNVVHILGVTDKGWVVGHSDQLHKATIYKKEHVRKYLTKKVGRNIEEDDTEYWDTVSRIARRLAADIWSLDKPYTYFVFTSPEDEYECVL